MLIRTGAIDYRQPINWQSPLSRGVVAWWRCLPLWTNGNRWLDLLGQNPAVFNGDMAAASATSGWNGTSRSGGDGEVRFDGTDDYGAINGFLGTTSLPVSVSVLLYIRAGSKGIRFAVANTGGATTRFYLGLQAAGSSDLGFRCGSVTISTSISDLTWYHLCGVWDGNGGIECYVNGVSIGTNASTGITTFNNVMKIGAFGNATSSYWDGGIDDVIVHQQRLESEQVAALYQSSLLGHPELLRRRVVRYYSVPAVLGRTTFNTRSHPLGIRAGHNRRISLIES